MQTAPDDDIRLIYIGSMHRSIHYAHDHLGAPPVKAKQILAVTTVEDLEGLQLAPDCHIAVELHTTKSPPSTVPNVVGAEEIFQAALARRRKIEKGGE